MKVTGVFSDRSYQSWPSWQIIFEWEDVIAERLSISVKDSPYFDGHFLGRRVSSIGKKLFKDDLTSLATKVQLKNSDRFLYFEMSPKTFGSFSTTRNFLPIIVDFFDKENVKHFTNRYRKCDYVLISSLEVLNFLKNHHCNLNLIHCPLSLPDKYKLAADVAIEKRYDVVVLGRSNPVLWNYLLSYAKNHPDVEYVFQEAVKGEFFYRSNKNGIVGRFNSRDEYMNLARSARIALYATPGIDGGERRTNGFNPVTPRFFELLSAGCHVIARYPQNSDTAFFDMNSICPSIDSYGDFEDRINRALNESMPPVEKNSSYLISHYTSERVKILEKLK